MSNDKRVQQLRAELKAAQKLLAEWDEIAQAVINNRELTLIGMRYEDENVALVADVLREGCAAHNFKSQLTGETGISPEEPVTPNSNTYAKLYILYRDRCWIQEHQIQRLESYFDNSVKVSGNGTLTRDDQGFYSVMHFTFQGDEQNRFHSSYQELALRAIMSELVEQIDYIRRGTPFPISQYSKKFTKTELAELCGSGRSQPFVASYVDGVNRKWAGGGYVEPEYNKPNKKNWWTPGWWNRR